MNSGNERLSFSVRVLTPTYADDSQDPNVVGRDSFDVHRERVGLVFDVLRKREIATLLTAEVDDFTVFGFGDFKSFEASEEGDCWAETWKRRIYCCAADL